MVEYEPLCKKPCYEGISNELNDIGIEEFYNNDSKGFSGIVKERWEDFIVNEVDLKKKIITYTNAEIIEMEAEIVAENKHLSEEIVQKLKCANESKVKTEVSFEASDDKEERTEIYKYLKSYYPKLCGSTIDIDGKKMFVVTNCADDRTMHDRRKPKGPKKYIQFVLHKKGIDTISAIDLIAKHTRNKPGFFSYAGTKDRRAITSQLICVKGATVGQIKGLNKCLRNIHLGNFEYVDNPLHLGDLFGNRFRLVIRNVIEMDDTVIENSIQSFSKGFINYFGSQRFGSSDIKTYELGKMAISGNWLGMIEAILKPMPQDLPEMKRLKEKLSQTGLYNEFVAKASSGIERTLASGVQKHGMTLNAVEFLPRNLRQMYVHSYQSRIWNKVASRRFRDPNMRKVLPGDLVYDKDSEVESKERVHIVLEDEVDNYQLTDVLLPLPGYDIKLPDNELKNWFNEMLQEDGLTLEKLKHRVKDFSLPGDYRKMIVIPEAVNHRIHMYDVAEEPLIGSDYQIASGSFVLPPSEGSKKAVILEFTLPKSCYATVAMRELMRTVTVMQ